ncbi:MAG: hypothetical protein KBG29_13775 [Pseudomonadales bacterium]|nr:hypothetical protein [Pseudomonadales bacterium]MBP9034965.1 hypothetical protein [Pseudomonadales bacterium]
MKHSKASRLAVATLGLALMAPWFANAQPVDESPSALAMAGDLVIARPLLVVATVAGAAAFLVSLPFTAAGGNMEQAADTLMAGPAEAAFVRCLGCRSGGRRQNVSNAD